jgi:flavin reductase (DIM6/NTAB) family NADH-FMN oxidoreductase RutF/DNA-binding IclR family transcriptional regulator
MTSSPSGSSTEVIDPQWHRRVLGQYPTGVCAVTANAPAAGPSGMVVGSFTSVSLDPPLIAFYPARASTSWPKIASTGSFCVNILGADQEDVCRAFSSKAPNKFENIPHHAAPETGSPIIDDVVAWIDCDIELVRDAGDHVLVLGRVRALDLESPRLPLLFFQGGYGRFAPFSLAASDTGGSLTTPLRHVDLIRPQMEQIAERFSCRCVAGARSGDDVVIVASAGQSQEEADTATLVGQRLPHLPPSGSVFAAWGSPEEQQEWLRCASEPDRTQHQAALELVRARGYSLGLLSSAQRKFASTLEAMAQAPSATWHTSLLGLIPHLSYDPPQLTADTLSLVRQIAAPVFGPDGSVALALTLFGYGAPPEGSTALISALVETAAAATERIGGVTPERPSAPQSA